MLEYSQRIVVRAERLVGRPNQLPQTWGDYTAGTAGTSSPVSLAAAQPFPVYAIWKRDGTSDRWLMWAPGLPAFANTLNGRLAPDDYVVVQIRK